jgi:NAD+ kinase
VRTQYGRPLGRDALEPYPLKPGALPRRPACPYRLRVVAGDTPQRLALVVHPSRPVDRALQTLGTWAERHGVELVEVSLRGTGRRAFPPGTVQRGDLVVALGGDGTALAALRAAAAVDAPVLAVACGSVGALSTVTGEALADALERMQGGDWTTYRIPALVVEAPHASDDIALNDFVVVRRGSGQIVAEVALDGELYVRLAGDGVIVATPLGSSGYTMAAGGPLLSLRTPAFVCTPLAMHGGSAAPLVMPADGILTVDVHPSYAGYDVELDGQRQALAAGSFRIRLEPERAGLVRFSPAEEGLERLRQRGLIADSPRALVRLQRAADDARAGR